MKMNNNQGKMDAQDALPSKGLISNYPISGGFDSTLA